MLSDTLTKDLNTDSACPALTAFDVEQSHRSLEESRDSLINAVQGLSQAQWHFKPSPESWSIAETLEHTVVVQERVLGSVPERLADAPLAPVSRDFKEVDDIILTQFATFPGKVAAPEPLQPTGRWEPPVALDRLIANCVGLQKYVESNPRLRERTIFSPPLSVITGGKLDQMDGYQYVLAAATHTGRHVHQILTVKNHRDFPSA